MLNENDYRNFAMYIKLINKFQPYPLFKSYTLYFILYL